METARVTRRVDNLSSRWVPVVLVGLAGLLWLSSVDWKVPTEFGDRPDGCVQLCRFVQAGIDYPVVPGTDAILEDVVQPNFEIFGWLVLISEAALAALLISRRYLRVAAVLGVAQSLAIGLTVANSKAPGPEEWYWSYLLMIALHLAVLAFALELRPVSAKAMAVVAALYGVAVALVHIEAGFDGDKNSDWTVFGGGRDIPDELGRGTFPGSIALGALFLIVAAAAWILADTERLRFYAGWVTVGVAVALLLTYRDDGTAIGLGSQDYREQATAIGLASKASTTAVLAAVGLSLTAPRAQLRTRA